MIAALLLTDLVFVVSVGTFAMLVYYGIANIAALKLPPEKRRYHAGISVIGASSCVVLMVFLSPGSIVIGIAGIAIGTVYYAIRRPGSSAGISCLTK